MTTTTNKQQRKDTGRRKQSTKADPIDMDVLTKLQAYAQFYFSEIVALNNADGEYLKAGEYTAKEMTDNSHKNVFGRCYKLPDDKITYANVYIKSGNFECSFKLCRIFDILAQWEKITKSRTKFIIGNENVITAKVVTSGKNGFKSKSMQLRQITGNWYAPTRFKATDERASLVYNLNGVYFQPGARFDVEMLKSTQDSDKECIKNWCNSHDDDYITTQITCLLKVRQIQGRTDDANSYFAHIADLAGITAKHKQSDDNNGKKCAAVA